MKRSHPERARRTMPPGPRAPLGSLSFSSAVWLCVPALTTAYDPSPVTPWPQAAAEQTPMPDPSRGRSDQVPPRSADPSEAPSARLNWSQARFVPFAQAVAVAVAVNVGVAVWVMVG